MNTLTADYTELTALLNADAAARAQARTLANIARRAETLFTEYGYTAHQSPVFPRLWAVVSPKGDVYTVRAASVVPGDEFLGDRCDCPCFEKLLTCKHLQAVLLQADEAAREAAQIAAFEEAEEQRNFGQFDRYDY